MPTKPGERIKRPRNQTLTSNPSNSKLPPINLTKLSNGANNSFSAPIQTPRVEDVKKHMVGVEASSPAASAKSDRSVSEINRSVALDGDDTIRSINNIILEPLSKEKRGITSPDSVAGALDVGIMRKNTSLSPINSGATVAPVSRGQLAQKNQGTRQSVSASGKRGGKSGGISM